VRITPACAAAAILVLAGASVGASAVFAQDRRMFVEAGGVFSTQGGEIPQGSASLPTTGLNGSGPGFSAAVGSYLTPSLSLAFEASVPARFDAEQVDSALIHTKVDTSHRDIIFSGAIRVDVSLNHTARLSVVGGPSFVWEDSLRRTADEMSFFDNTGPRLTTTGRVVPTGTYNAFGAETRITRATFGLMAGIDASFTVARRVEIVPQIRAHWVDRADVTQTVVRGLDSFILRPAISVRLRF
jgi:hypothetical protein